MTRRNGPTFDKEAIERIEKLTKAKMEGRFSEAFDEMFPETPNDKMISSDPAAPTPEQKQKPIVVYKPID